MAVRKGATKPDISSVAAFRQAMLDAKSIACPDPAKGGSSGLHVATVFERLRIASSVRSKLLLVSTPDKPDTMPGYVIADGRAEIALHQMQELLAVPNIEIVGPLPTTCKRHFFFPAQSCLGAGM